jgi:hypothetical protein
MIRPLMTAMPWPDLEITADPFKNRIEGNAILAIGGAMVFSLNCHT